MERIRVLRRTRISQITRIIGYAELKVRVRKNPKNICVIREIRVRKTNSIMKIAKKDIEAIIWLLREIIALFLKLKKKNKDEKENEDNEKD